MILSIEASLLPDHFHGAHQRYDGVLVIVYSTVIVDDTHSDGAFDIKFFLNVVAVSLPKLLLKQEM